MIIRDNLGTMREDRPIELTQATAQMTEKQGVAIDFLRSSCPYNADTIIERNPLLKHLVKMRSEQ